MPTQVGVYAGNGNASRTIPTNLPYISVVWVTEDDPAAGQVRAEIKSANQVAVGSTPMHGSGYATANRIERVWMHSFVVGTALNRVGRLYVWVAFMEDDDIFLTTYTGRAVSIFNGAAILNINAEPDNSMNSAPLGALGQVWTNGNNDVGRDIGRAVDGVRIATVESVQGINNARYVRGTAIPGQYLVGGPLGEYQWNDWGAIVRLPFEPQLLMIWSDTQDVGNLDMAWWSRAKRAAVPSAATVVYPTGWTVGGINVYLIAAGESILQVGGDMNVTGREYHVFALRNQAGSMFIQDYLGDGVYPRDITGAGFNPTLVWICRFDGAGIGYCETSLAGGPTNAPNMGDTDTALPNVGVFIADGFRIESDLNFVGGDWTMVMLGSTNPLPTRC